MCCGVLKIALQSGSHHRGPLWLWPGPLTLWLSGAFHRSIILNNPKKRNALSLAMLKSLQRDILHEADSKDLKVIIISGTIRWLSLAFRSAQLSHFLGLMGAYCHFPGELSQRSLTRVSTTEKSRMGPTAYMTAVTCLCLSFHALAYADPGISITGPHFLTDPTKSV